MVKGICTPSCLWVKCIRGGAYYSMMSGQALDIVSLITIGTCSIFLWWNHRRWPQASDLVQVNIGVNEKYEDLHVIILLLATDLKRLSLVNFIFGISHELLRWAKLQSCSISKDWLIQKATVVDGVLDLSEHSLLSHQLYFCWWWCCTLVKLSEVMSSEWIIILKKH